MPRKHQDSLLRPGTSTLIIALLALSLLAPLACSPGLDVPQADDSFKERADNVPEELGDLVPIAHKWASESNYSEVATEAEIREPVE